MLNLKLSCAVARCWRLGRRGGGLCVYMPYEAGPNQSNFLIKLPRRLK